MTTPSKPRVKETTKRVSIPIEGITLSKEGNNTVVYVEFKGKKYRVISETENFYHNITAYGIMEAIQNEE